MNIIKNLKKFTGNFIFKNKLSKLKRNKTLINLNKAKDIALVYKVNNEQDYNRINELIKSLKEKKKTVLTIGFINNKYIPPYCLSGHSGFFINLKDLNWYGKPKNDFINEFIKKEFDIIIDLSLEDNFALQYISGLSKSKLKVGRFGNNNSNYYDLMIQTKNETTLNEYIEQLVHYLSILNNKDNE